MEQTIRSLLNERYAPLHDLSERTVRLYGYTLDRFRDFLGREPLVSDLEDLTLARFLRWRAATPHRGRLASTNSVIKDRTQLLALANHAAKKRMVEFVTLSKARPVERTPRGYTSADVAAMIREARTRRGRTGGVPSGWWWPTLIYCGWCTAGRLGEMLALRWSSVDLEARTVLYRAETRKGHTRDVVRSLTPQLAAWLAQQRRQPGDRVWEWDREPTSIWTSLRLLCRRAGVTYRGFHGLRKASASYYEAAGGSATQLLDHDRPSTTRKSYLDPSIVRGGPSAAELLPHLDLDDEPGTVLLD
jgi:integrase